MAKSKGTFINVKVDAELKRSLLALKKERNKGDGEKTSLNEIVGKALASYVNRATA